jgi:hypothetical protein
MANNGCRIIIGLGSMAGYLNVSKPTISTYIKLGMPSNRLNNVWHFHLDLVDRWFKEMCAAQYKGETDPSDLEADENG